MHLHSRNSRQYGNGKYEQLLNSWWTSPSSRRACPPGRPRSRSGFRWSPSLSRPSRRSRSEARRHRQASRQTPEHHGIRRVRSPRWRCGTRARAVRRRTYVVVHVAQHEVHQEGLALAEGPGHGDGHHLSVPDLLRQQDAAQRRLVQLEGVVVFDQQHLDRPGPSIRLLFLRAPVVDVFVTEGP